MIEASNTGKAGPAQHPSEDASPPAPSTPGFVRCCLRAKKYELDMALQVATNYARFRARTGWGGASVRAAALRRELRSGLNLLLPYPDAEGNVVLTQTMRKMLHSGCALEGLQRAGYYLLHRALQRRTAQERGVLPLTLHANPNPAP